jgi:hypothetical protein
MVRRAGCHHVQRTCALALTLLLACAHNSRSQELLVGGPTNQPSGAPIDLDASSYAASLSEAWIAPPSSQAVTPVPYATEPAWGDAVVGSGPADFWYWQLMPKGLIYHSYQASVHEPRLAIIAEHEFNSGESFWDGTVGGRVGVVRFGNGQQIFPQGWQLDVEAAAMLRMTFDEIRDFETADYRVGVPLTYGIDNWQYKFAVYHLSSHLGDEFAIRNPGSLASRINYVRDSLVFGASYYPHPVARLYGEAGWCFNADGGAEPWEFQFGTELSRPGPTGFCGTPFLAINAHLREEVDFGGDITAQTGWLWRNDSGQVARVGLHYFNGKSSQYQTFNQFEQQLGVGLWYDF